MALSNAILATPSTLVVPLSAIIDRLQGKLSAADLNALLLSVTGTVKSQVQPGDLISADLVNEVLAAIADLQLRVAALETGVGKSEPGQVVVFEPPVGASMRVGELLQIVGLNFGFSGTKQRVTFDDLPVSGFASGSGDNLLRVVVPALPNIGQGRAVVLSVGNGSSTASRAVTVLPPDQPLTGTIDIEAKSPEPSPFTAGANADFPFVLSPRGLNRSAEFQLTPALVGQPWSSQLRVLGPNKEALSGGRLPISPGQPVNAYLRLEPVPANSNGQAFTLALSIASGTVGGSSPIASYVVNQAQQPSDDTIKLTLGNVSPSGTVVNGEIRLAAGGFANIPVGLQSTKPGGPFQYDLSLSIVAESPGGALATGWSFGFMQPATNPPSQPNTTTPSIGANGSMVFAVAADNNASVTGRLRLLVQRKNEALAKALELNLKRV